jgi:hypothetical protein
MNNPRQDRAAKHLQGWLEYKPDLGISEQERAEFLKIFIEKADDDLADCNTDDQYRKVWAALSAGLLEHLNGLDIESAALRSLHDNLLNSALLRPSKVNLGAKRSGQTKPLPEEWSRACVIALWERFPERRAELSTECKNHTHIESLDIPKLVENFKNGTLGRGDLINLVETARNRIEKTGANTVKSLL